VAAQALVVSALEHSADWPNGNGWQLAIPASLVDIRASVSGDCDVVVGLFGCCAEGFSS
jgi:hypothetical protein